MSRKSGITFEAGKMNNFFHNTREQPTKNSIFTTEDNFTNRSGMESKKLYKELIEEREEIYRTRTGQKVQSKTIKLFQCIVNLDDKHTKEDLLKVVEMIEEEYDTKVIQYSLHRDEGFEEEDKKGINFHGHLEFLGLDSEGKSVRQKMTRKNLIEMQTKVAALLEMERGLTHEQRKEQGVEKSVRLSTYEYKEHMKKQNEVVKDLKVEVKEVKVKLKDLKEENKSLRTFIQENKGTREDYKLLEEEMKMLKIEVKNKTLTETQLRKQLDLVKSQLTKQLLINESSTYTSEEVDMIKQDYERQLSSKDNEIKELEEEIKRLKGTDGDDTDIDFNFSEGRSKLPAVSTDTKKKGEHPQVRNLGNYFKR